MVGSGVEAPRVLNLRVVWLGVFSHAGALPEETNLTYSSTERTREPDFLKIHFAVILCSYGVESPVYHLVILWFLNCCYGLSFLLLSP